MHCALRRNSSVLTVCAKSASSALSAARSSLSPLAHAFITEASILPSARTRAAEPALKSPSSAAAQRMSRPSSPRYAPAVSFSIIFSPGLLLSRSRIMSKSPCGMPSYSPDSRFTRMLPSSSRPSLGMRRYGRAQQVFVPVPLICPIKPPYALLSSVQDAPSSAATVSLRMKTRLPVIPRRASSAVSDAPTSLPDEPVITTSLSMRLTSPSISGVISAL